MTNPPAREGASALRLSRAIGAWVLALHRRDQEAAVLLVEDVLLERPTVAELINAVAWSVARLPHSWDPADGGPLAEALSTVFSAVPPHPAIDTPGAQPC